MNLQLFRCHHCAKEWFLFGRFQPSISGNPIGSTEGRGSDGCVNHLKSQKNFETHVQHHRIVNLFLYGYHLLMNRLTNHDNQMVQPFFQPNRPVFFFRPRRRRAAKTWRPRGPRSWRHGVVARWGPVVGCFVCFFVHCFFVFLSSFVFVVGWDL